jgi:hypothetical protein
MEIVTMLTSISFVYIGHKDGRAKLAYLHARNGLLLVKRKRDDEGRYRPAWTSSDMSEVDVLRRLNRGSWQDSDVIIGDILTDEVRSLLEADSSITLATPERALEFLKRQRSKQAAADALHEASRKAAADTLGWDLDSMASGAAPGAAPASPFEKAAPAAPATFRVATAACPKGKDMTIEAIQGLADQEVDAYVLEGDSWTPIADSAALKEAGLLVVPASPFEDASKRPVTSDEVTDLVARALAAALADRG